MKKALVGFGIILGVSTLTACTSKNGENVTSRSDASTQQKESASTVKAEPSTSSEESSATSQSSESSEEKKLQYVIVSRKSEKKNFIHGSVELHGGDGTKVDVKVDDNDIKAGSYQATWTPGAIGGSSKDYGYGIIYINGDQNSNQVEPDKPTDVTFKDGDTITFQFAGNGDNDKLTLDQK